MSLVFGSLFAGIGGIDLGLERAGMRCAFQVEIDPFCQGVLTRHWPDVPRFGDITKVDPDDLPAVDVLAGGFPCQPVSLAGRRRGSDDERWLWPEFERLIAALRPRYVLAENVRGLRTKGLDQVLEGLAALRYDAEWQVVSAASVGAPHLRERIIIVAYPVRERRQESSQPDGQPATGGVLSQRDDANRLRDPLADAQRKRLDWGPSIERVGRGSTIGGQAVDHARHGGCSRLDPSRAAGETVYGPAAIERLGRCGGALRGQWAVEPDVGRVAHGVPDRMDRLKALGNAVVPQVAEFVGRLIVADHEG